jgi:hypothetical protein
MERNPPFVWRIELQARKRMERNPPFAWRIELQARLI